MFYANLSKLNLNIMLHFRPDFAVSVLWNEKQNGHDLKITFITYIGNTKLAVRSSVKAYICYNIIVLCDELNLKYSAVDDESVVLKKTQAF